MKFGVDAGTVTVTGDSSVALHEMDKAVFIDPQQEQLDRIEQKLDQLLERKKPSKPREGKKHEYDADFAGAWHSYPARSGSNPKNKAYSAWNARLDEKGTAFYDMLQGVHRYRNYCDATVDDKRFVMQAATFFGPDKHYENDWTIPKKKPTEDPDKQHHKTFDPNAEVVIPAGQNPYEDM